MLSAVPGSLEIYQSIHGFFAVPPVVSFPGVRCFSKGDAVRPPKVMWLYDQWVRDLRVRVKGCHAGKDVTLVVAKDILVLMLTNLCLKHGKVLYQATSGQVLCTRRGCKLSVYCRSLRVGKLGRVRLGGLSVIPHGQSALLALRALGVRLGF